MPRPASRSRRRVTLLLGVAALLWCALAPTACVEACDEALDLCRDCDRAPSTCESRFADAAPETCERAVNAYLSSEQCADRTGTDCDAEQPDPTM